MGMHNDNDNGEEDDLVVSLEQIASSASTTENFSLSSSISETHSVLRINSENSVAIEIVQEKKETNDSTV
jgi:hypothetical protein